MLSFTPPSIFFMGEYERKSYSRGASPLVFGFLSLLVSSCPSWWKSIHRQKIFTSKRRTRATGNIQSSESKALEPKETGNHEKGHSRFIRQTGASSHTTSFLRSPPRNF